MWPGACRKSLESLYPGVLFLPVLVFDFISLLQGMLQEGGAQTSGKSISLMPLVFLGNYQGWYFAAVITNFDAFGIVVPICICSCCFAIEGKARLGSSVSLIFSVYM